MSNQVSHSCVCWPVELITRKIKSRAANGSHPTRLSQRLRVRQVQALAGLWCRNRQHDARRRYRHVRHLL